MYPNIKMAEEQRQLEILVIDDDPGIRDLLADLITDYAEEKATIAVDGRDGINKYVEMLEAGTPYDVVFTDLKMPNKNGVDVIREVKKRSPKTLVYVITGYEENDEYEKLSAQLKELKPDGVIPKPFDKKCILNLIEQIKLYVDGDIKDLPAYQPPQNSQS